MDAMQLSVVPYRKRRHARAAFALLLAWPAAAQAQSPVSTPLTVTWTQSEPRQIFFETDRGEVALRRTERAFSGRTPASSASLARVPLVARYPDSEVKLQLRVRYGLPDLRFELPRPTPGFCHAKFVDQVRAIPTTYSTALRLMLQADHLLRLESPNDCSAQDRKILIQARFQRNQDLIRLASYFDIVPQFRTEYFALLRSQSGSSEQYLAALEGLKKHQVDADATELSLALAAAVQRQEWVVAATINSELIDNSTRDSHWRLALTRRSLEPDDLTRNARVFSAQMLGSPATRFGWDDGNPRRPQPRIAERSLETLGKRQASDEGDEKVLREVEDVGRETPPDRF